MPTSANADRDREHLAPLGHLRVGVFAGSPLSMVVDRNSEPAMAAVRGFVTDVQSSGLLVRFESASDCAARLRRGCGGFAVVRPVVG